MFEQKKCCYAPFIFHSGYLAAIPADLTSMEPLIETTSEISDQIAAIFGKRN